MGLAFSFLPFLDACARLGAIGGPMLGLGALTLQESAESVAAFALQHLSERLGRERSVAAFLSSRYQVDDYEDCDINGAAALRLDLSQPAPTAMTNKYATVLNGGTLEHIFDIRQAFETIHDMVRVHGTMIHMVPVSWYNHGFVNFNPKLFANLAHVNAYEKLVEALYFAASGRNEKRATELEVIYDLSVGLDRSGELLALNSEGSLPNDCVYMIALRKQRSGKFCVPIDVS